MAAPSSPYVPLDRQHQHIGGGDGYGDHYDEDMDLIGGHHATSPVTPVNHTTLVIEPQSSPPSSSTIPMQPLPMHDDSHANHHDDESTSGIAAVCRIWMITMILAISLAITCVSISGSTRWYTWLPSFILSLPMIIVSIIALRMLRFYCCGVPPSLSNKPSPMTSSSACVAYCSYPCRVDHTSCDGTWTIAQRRARLRHMRYIGIVIGSTLICTGVAYFVANSRFMITAPWLIIPIILGCCQGCCQWLLMMVYNEVDSPIHTLPSSIPPYLLRRLQVWSAAHHDGEALSPTVSLQPPDL